jgi:hypothetical protein
MMLEEYMQTKGYPKIERETRAELDNALRNLQSDDVALRKQGAKRLSWNSRKELGWNCYPVRIWFLDPGNKEELFRLTGIEPDIKTQSDLLLTLGFFYNRYMIHPFWKEVVTEPELQSYNARLLSFAEGFIENPSPEIRYGVACILAMLEDGRAWDIYHELIQKRANMTAGLRLDGHYAVKSMSSSQSKKLIATLGEIAAKTKNKSVKREAESAIEIFGKLFA